MAALALAAPQRRSADAAVPDAQLLVQVNQVSRLLGDDLRAPRGGLPRQLADLSERDLAAGRDGARIRRDLTSLGRGCRGRLCAASSRSITSSSTSSRSD